MSILAPGFTDDAEQRRLAIELTQITFPYLSADHAGDAVWRNAQRHASVRQRCGGADFSQYLDDGDAGFGGILPNRRSCGGVGSTDIGFLQYFLLAGDLALHGGLPRFAPLKLDDDARSFFRALGPARLVRWGRRSRCLPTR